jgi:hypothetical protein
MRYSIAPAFLILLIAGVSFAQSGRKAKAPAPTSTPVADSPADRSEYSESAPTTGPSYSRKRPKAQADAPKTVQPTADNKASGDEDIIRVSTDLVTVPVSVFERSGIYVSGLRRNDFKVFDNGKEQEIAYFGNNEVPFSVVLLIDTSGSTDTKIADIQNAALEFVGNLLPADKVMVMQFSDVL